MLGRSSGLPAYLLGLRVLKLNTDSSQNSCKVFSVSAFVQLKSFRGQVYRNVRASLLPQCGLYPSRQGHG